MTSLRQPPISVSAFATTLLIIALVAIVCTSGTSPDSEAPTATPASGSSDLTSGDADAGADSTSTPADQSADASVPVLVPASNRIAITSADGSIYTIDPDGSDRARVTLAGGQLGGQFAAFYAWPSWSPDGRHLLVTAFTPDIAGGFETSLLRVTANGVDNFPELLYRDVPGTTGIGGIPHFPIWHPDGGSVAIIANVGEGLSTFLVDVVDGVGPAVSNGAPVYLDWSQDGSHLLVHTAERLVLHDFGSDGKRTGSQQIGLGSISYRVPKFAPNSDRYAYIDLADGLRSLLIGSPAADSPMQVRLARSNNSFAWSPDGERLAFADGSRSGFYEMLRIIDPDGDESDDVIVDTPLLAFWWSPDGESILLAMPGGESENAALAVVDANTGDVNFLGLIAPSAEMGFVIGFFDQYAADLRLWSPDSSRFVFGGTLKEGLLPEDGGTQVQLGDFDTSIWVIDPSGSEPPISLGAGGFGTWSPE